MASVQPLSKPQTSATLDDNTQNPLFDSGGEEGPYESGVSPNALCVGSSLRLSKIFSSLFPPNPRQLTLL